MNAAVLVLVVAALTLVLVVSGIAKLFSRKRSQDALRALRLPGLLTTRAFAVGWAIAEIAVGAGLLMLPGSWAPAAGVAAAAMMTGHLVVVVRASRFPEEVHCHCFGALDNEPVGLRTIVRNVGFLALALIAVGGLSSPTPVDRSILGIASTLQGAELGLLQLGLLAAGVGVFALVWRSVGSVSTSLDGRRSGLDRRTQGALDERTTRPSSEVERSLEPQVLAGHKLPDIFGANPDVRSFTGEQRSVLVLLSTSCSACRTLAEQLPAWRSELAAIGVHLRVVTPAPAASALTTFPLLGSYLHHDVDGTLAAELGITTYPAAITVGRDGPGSLDDGPAVGSHAVSTLIDNVRAAEGVRA